MRAFVAVKVSEEIRALCREIEELLRKTGVRMKLVEPENVHVTMKFLGDIDELKARRICEILDQIECRGEARTTVIGAFPNDGFIRVIWIGLESEELVKAKKLLDEALEKLGFSKDLNFVPHITLARIKERPNNKLRLILGKRINGKFSFDRMVLMKSTLTREGPIYEEIC